MALVRRAHASDAQAIAAVHIAAIREVCSAAYPAAQIEAWASSKHPDRYLAPIASQPFFVAEQSGEIVAFAQLELERAEIQALYVRPDCLRRGVGRQLLRELETVGLRLALRRLSLSSSLNAVPFYTAHGYVAEPPTSVSLGPGIELACVPMHKQLA
jgi:GNAT superfamily N-acetyltransferase